MEKIVKTANQIARQIEQWFLKYHRKEKSAFDGTEVFSIFHHLYYEKQNELIRKMDLKKAEIPVLVFFLNNNEFIINTTERFIHIDNSGIESLFYTDFKGHIGYKTFAVGQPMSSKKVSVKMEGYTAEFGLEKNDGQIIFWLIPTGEPGFAFWNVTAKCALIGRKYLIKDHE